MPRIVNNRNTNREGSPQERKIPFQCRVCKQFHPLRVCKRFLSMDTSKRWKTVKQHKYCQNCLAHKHSHRTCFSKSGCHICKRSHHTLLHTNGYQQSRRSVTTVSPNRSSVILSQQTITILPTAVAKISINGRLYPIRILLDTGSSISFISKALVSKLRIKTRRVDDSTLCDLIIKSSSDKSVRLEIVVRVENRITMKTPSKSLPATFREKFVNLVLADPTFYECSPISMVIGSDFYSKIILNGILPNHDGLPMAQNSVFGWLLSGTCSV